jgi:hypothetical protein
VVSFSGPFAVVGEFTRATFAEPGCRWFDWSRGIEDPAECEYVLVEAFRDDEDGAVHVGSARFNLAGIYTKLGVDSRTAAVATAAELGIVRR